MTESHEQDRFLESVARYLDGDLSDLEVQQLSDVMLRESHRRSEFIEFCIQAQLIREYGESLLEAKPSINQGSRSREDFGDSPASTEKLTTSKRLWVNVVVVSTFAAAVLIAAFLWLPRVQVTDPIAVLHQNQGKVRVTRINDDGHTKQTFLLDADDEFELYLGDVVEIEEAGGRARLHYADETEIQLFDELTMKIEQGIGKQIRLDSGTVIASVAPQAQDQPMMLVTAHATVHVLGTVFSVVAAKERTDVSVNEGRVRLTRETDGASVNVDQGEFVVADQKRELVAQDIPQPPDQWSVDFEQGLSDDWGRGVLESTALPAGSRGAVRAARVENDDGVYYQVQAPKQWTKGIFSTHDNTHLHFTFKLERPDWFQVFVATRPFDPDLPPTFLYRFRDDRLWETGNRGRWLRVTIPLTSFERVPEKKGTPPLGEVPFELLFSSKGEDRGLVIDWIEVSRGGPGRITIEEVK